MVFDLKSFWAGVRAAVQFVGLTHAAVQVSSFVNIQKLPPQNMQSKLNPELLSRGQQSLKDRL